MRSWDPMRNFPELDALPDAEAKALVASTQKEVVRQPLILGGLVAAITAAALVLFNLPFASGLIGATLAGAGVGIAAVAYLALVVRPRMRERFRIMGYASTDR